MWLVCVIAAALRTQETTLDQTHLLHTPEREGGGGKGGRERGRGGRGEGRERGREAEREREMKGGREEGRKRRREGKRKQLQYLGSFHHLKAPLTSLLDVKQYMHGNQPLLQGSSLCRLDSCLLDRAMEDGEEVRQEGGSEVLRSTESRDSVEVGRTGGTGSLTGVDTLKERERGREGEVYSPLYSLSLPLLLHSL